MHGYINRKYEKTLNEDLNTFPCVAILGPRQSGKSTLALNLRNSINNFYYLDLENPADLRKLDDPLMFFNIQKEKVICLDEIQRRPDLFPVLRGIIDSNRKKVHIILLGSASQELIRQSSESLAGRISYLELTPFIASEVCRSEEDIIKLWHRGGFPDSYLSDSDRSSARWRVNFIRTFLERDIPQYSSGMNSGSIARLWRMCAHSHGQILNSSRLGESMGVSYHTIKNYLNLLAGTFMIRLLEPYHTNLKRRMIKSPKVYIRDTGILHSLLDIETFDALMGHFIYGTSWEGFVIENILTEMPGYKGYFYRTSNGAEIDLILKKGEKIIAIECKSSSAPEITKGFRSAILDIGIEDAWVIAPVKESYRTANNITVAPLADFIKKYSTL